MSVVYLRPSQAGASGRTAINHRILPRSFGRSSEESLLASDRANGSSSVR